MKKQQTNPKSTSEAKLQREKPSVEKRPKSQLKMANKQTDRTNLNESKFKGKQTPAKKKLSRSQGGQKEPKQIAVKRVKPEEDFDEEINNRCTVSLKISGGQEGPAKKASIKSQMSDDIDRADADSKRISLETTAGDKKLPVHSKLAEMIAGQQISPLPSPNKIRLAQVAANTSILNSPESPKIIFPRTSHAVESQVESTDSQKQMMRRSRSLRNINSIRSSIQSQVQAEEQHEQVLSRVESVGGRRHRTHMITTTLSTPEDKVENGNGPAHIDDGQNPEQLASQHDSLAQLLMMDRNTRIKAIISNQIIKHEQTSNLEYMYRSRQDSSNLVSMFNQSSEKILASQSPIQNSSLPQNVMINFQNDQDYEEPGNRLVTPHPEILEHQMRPQSVSTCANPITPSNRLQEPRPTETRQSITDFLNQRVNLSNSRIQNEWLKDCTNQNSDSPPFKRRTSNYSTQNREKLERLEQELVAKRNQLLLSQQQVVQQLAQGGIQLRSADQLFELVEISRGHNSGMHLDTNNTIEEEQHETAKSTEEYLVTEEDMIMAERITLNLRAEVSASTQMSSRLQELSKPKKKFTEDDLVKKRSKSNNSAQSTDSKKRNDSKTRNQQMKGKEGSGQKRQYTFQPDSESTPSKSITPRNKQKAPKINEIDLPSNQDLPLSKHTAGIEPIMESEAAFEQTVEMPLERIPQCPLPVIDEEIIKQKRHVRNKTTLVDGPKQMTNAGARSASEQFKQLGIKQSAFKEDAMHSQQIDSRPAKKSKITMADLQKEYANRCESYLDFYRNVDNYTHYDRKAHYDEFLKRKNDEEKKKREATVKTYHMFYDSLLGTREGELAGAGTERVNVVKGLSKRNSGGRSTASKKDDSVFGQRKSSAAVLTGNHFQSFSMQIDSKNPLKSRQTQVERPSSLKKQNLDSSLVHSTHARPESVKRERPLTQMSKNNACGDYTFQRKKSASKQSKTPTASKKTKKPKKQINQNAAILFVSGTFLQQHQRCPSSASMTAVTPSNKPESSQRPSNLTRPSTITAQERNQKMEEKFQKLKPEIIKAFEFIGIKDQAALWDEEQLLTKGNDWGSQQLYLSRHQVRNVLVKLKYMTSCHQMLAESANSKLLDKLQKLETYQFEDLIQMLCHKRYLIPGKRGYVPTCSPSKADNNLKPVVCALSLISFILIMNDIVRDWMLVEEKRPPPKEEKPNLPQVEVQVPQKRLTKIEQRLLGINYIQDKEKQYLKKSVLARKKQEETRIKQMLEEVACSRKRDRSSSSEELKTEVIQGEYFMLRRKREVAMIQEQFSYLLQNRVEELESEPSQVKFLDLKNSSPSRSQQRNTQSKYSPQKSNGFAEQFKTVQNERTYTELKVTDPDQSNLEDQRQKTEVEVRCVTQTRSIKSKSEIVKSERESAAGKLKELFEMPLQVKIREAPSEVDLRSVSKQVDDGRRSNASSTSKVKKGSNDLSKSHITLLQRIESSKVTSPVKLKTPVKESRPRKEPSNHKQPMVSTTTPVIHQNRMIGPKSRLETAESTAKRVDGPRFINEDLIFAMKNDPQPQSLSRQVEEEEQPSPQKPVMAEQTAFCPPDMQPQSLSQSHSQNIINSQANPVKNTQALKNYKSNTEKAQFEKTMSPDKRRKSSGLKEPTRVSQVHHRVMSSEKKPVPPRSGSQGLKQPTQLKQPIEKRPPDHPVKNPVQLPSQQLEPASAPKKPEIRQEPILIVEVKLVKDQPHKIVVMENDDPVELVEKFCSKYSVDISKKQRLLAVMRQQIEEYYEGN